MKIVAKKGILILCRPDFNSPILNATLTSICFYCSIYIVALPQQYIFGPCDWVDFHPHGWISTHLGGFPPTHWVDFHPLHGWISTYPSPFKEVLKPQVQKSIIKDLKIGLLMATGTRAGS